MKKLAIITTHPIQYNAPFFKLLQQRGNVSIKVFYTWGDIVLQDKYDPGFDKSIQWDIPLLEGYEYEFVANKSKHPGSHHFSGIDNPTLIEEIINWKAQAVLVFGWAFKSHLKAIRYFHKRIPVYFRGDSTLIDEQWGVNKLLRRFFLKWVYRKVDVALYVGTLNCQYFLKHGLKFTQLVFAPHAIDNDRFANNEASLLHAELLRKQLGIKRDELVFLFAGKFEPKKNPLQFVKSFCSAGLKGAHLIMVGNGILQSQLVEVASLEKNIHFLPFQNQIVMPAIYQLCDIFVLPSIGPGETWGLAINEAMASGKAVLASKACGASVDLVMEGKNGYSFDPFKQNDLVQKITLMTQKKEHLAAWGKYSMEIIENWSFTKYCEVVEDLMHN